MSQDPTYGTDFSPKVLSNVVSNETDVKAVVSKVDMGEADAGIVYVTDAIAAPDLKTIAIPPNFNVIAHVPDRRADQGPQCGPGRGVRGLHPVSRWAGVDEEVGFFSG